MNSLKFPESILKTLKYTMSVSLLAGSLFSTSYVYAEAHVDNPFVDATSYLNPDYSKDIDTSITKVSDVSLKEKWKPLRTTLQGFGLIRLMR